MAHAPGPVSFQRCDPLDSRPSYPPRAITRSAGRFLPVADRGVGSLGTNLITFRRAFPGEKARKLPQRNAFKTCPILPRCNICFANQMHWALIWNQVTWGSERTGGSLDCHRFWCEIWKPADVVVVF